MPVEPAVQVVSFDHRMKSRFLSPPNLISIVRVVTIPVIFWCLKRTFDHLALVILGLALLSDAMDGYLARRFRWQSDWGLILDPLADKLLVGSLAVFLVIFRDFPVWMAGLIICRDVAIIGVGVFLFFRPYRFVVPSNRTGKVTTAITSLALLLYLVDIQPYGMWCVWLSAVSILGSGFHYTVNFIHLLKNQPMIVKQASKKSAEHSAMDATRQSGAGA